MSPRRLGRALSIGGGGELCLAVAASQNVSLADAHRRALAGARCAHADAGEHLPPGLRSRLTPVIVTAAAAESIRVASARSPKAPWRRLRPFVTTASDAEIWPAGDKNAHATSGWSGSVATTCAARPGSGAPLGLLGGHQARG